MTVLKLALVALLALGSPSGADDGAKRADRLLGEGLAHLTDGRTGEAISRFEAALGVYEELGDLRGRAECRLVMGVARTRLETYREALVDYRASLELWRRLEDPVGSWMVHFALAEARAFLEDNQRAFEDLKKASRFLDNLRRDESLALSMESFRIVALAYGLPVENLAMVSALVPDLRAILIGYMEAWTRIVEAKILRQQGRYPQARSVLEVALGFDERLALLGPVLLDDLGEIFLAEGDYEGALDHFEQAYNRATGLRDQTRRDLAIFQMPLAAADVFRPYEAEALQHIAMVYMLTGRYKEALGAALLGQASSRLKYSRHLFTYFTIVRWDFCFSGCVLAVGGTSWLA